MSLRLWLLLGISFTVMLQSFTPGEDNVGRMYDTNSQAWTTELNADEEQDADHRDLTKSQIDDMEVEHSK